MKLHALPRQSRRALALGLLAAVARSCIAAIVWWLLSAFVFDLNAKASAVETRVTSDQLGGWFCFPTCAPPGPASSATRACRSTCSRRPAMRRRRRRSSLRRRSCSRARARRSAPSRRSTWCRRARFAGSASVSPSPAPATRSTARSKRSPASRPVLIVAQRQHPAMGDSRRPVDDPATPQLQATFDIFAFARNG